MLTKAAATIHYVTDCPTGRDGDTLAVTWGEYGSVSCPDCIGEMAALGVL